MAAGMALERCEKLEARVAAQDSVIAKMEERLARIEQVSPITARRAPMPRQKFPEALLELGHQPPKAV